MTARKHPPLLMRSPLTDQLYIVTRYARKTASNGAEYYLAHEKYEVSPEQLASVGLVKEGDWTKDPTED